MAEAGVKHDTEKLRYDLLPPEALEALAEVYTIGATKYGDNNYLRGMDWNRIYGAMVRHLQAFWQGESFDKEDGQHHLAAVAWCAFTLLVYERRGIGVDNRPNTILAQGEIREILQARKEDLDGAS